MTFGYGNYTFQEISTAPGYAFVVPNTPTISIPTVPQAPAKKDVYVPAYVPRKDNSLKNILIGTAATAAIAALLLSLKKGKKPTLPPSVPETPKNIETTISNKTSGIFSRVKGWFKGIFTRKTSNIEKSGPQYVTPEAIRRATAKKKPGFFTRIKNAWNNRKIAKQKQSAFNKAVEKESKIIDSRVTTEAQTKAAKSEAYRAIAQQTDKNAATVRPELQQIKQQMLDEAVNKVQAADRVLEENAKNLVQKTQRKNYLDQIKADEIARAQRAEQADLLQTRYNLIFRKSPIVHTFKEKVQRSFAMLQIGVNNVVDNAKLALKSIFSKKYTRYESPVSLNLTSRSASKNIAKAAVEQQSDLISKSSQIMQFRNEKELQRAYLQQNLSGKKRIDILPSERKLLGWNGVPAEGTINPTAATKVKTSVTSVKVEAKRARKLEAQRLGEAHSKWETEAYERIMKEEAADRKFAEECARETEKLMARVKAKRPESIEALKKNFNDRVNASPLQLTYNKKPEHITPIIKGIEEKGLMQDRYVPDITPGLSAEDLNKMGNTKFTNMFRFWKELQQNPNMTKEAIEAKKAEIKKLYPIVKGKQNTQFVNENAKALISDKFSTEELTRIYEQFPCQELREMIIFKNNMARNHK